jgi:hypothetical protein
VGSIGKMEFLSHPYRVTGATNIEGVSREGESQMKEMTPRLRLLFAGTTFALLAFSSCVKGHDIQSSSNVTVPKAVAFDRVTLIFNNSKCEAL